MYVKKQTIILKMELEFKELEIIFAFCLRIKTREQREVDINLKEMNESYRYMNAGKLMT